MSDRVRWGLGSRALHGMAFVRLTVTCVCLRVTACLGSAHSRSTLSCLCVSVCCGVRACVCVVRSFVWVSVRGRRSYDLDCTSAQLPPNGCLPCQCTPPDVYETVLTQHLQAVMAAAQTCVPRDVTSRCIAVPAWRRTTCLCGDTPSLLLTLARVALRHYLLFGAPSPLAV